MTVLFVPALLGAAEPQSASPPVGASTPDVAADTTGGSSSLQGRLMALGGVGGIGGDGLHAFGGTEAGVLLGRIGVMALGQHGRGNGFQSLLLAGGPAVEVLETERAALIAWAGLARYSEQTGSGVTRAMTGLQGALSVRIPVSVGAVGVQLSVWRGTLDGEGISDPPTVTSHRLSIGFGL